MYKHRSWWRTRVAGGIVLGLSIASAFVLVMSRDSSASGGDWTPAGDEVVVDSSDISFSIGTIEVTCDVTAGIGTLKTESSTWDFKPTFSDCNHPVTVKGEWTATDVNSSEATLTIPKEEKAVDIEVSSECSVYIEGGTIGSSGDYDNGESGVTEPSELELFSQTVTVKDSTKACVELFCRKGEEAKSATVSGTLGLLNYSNEAEPIKVS